MTTGSPDPATDTLEIRFTGRRRVLFWLALRTGILTVLTLGLYRFWMKTRLRRYLWSSVEIGGDPLEYTGRPLEKLTGFFFAVVVLTFYIGLVNLTLMFASYSWFGGNVVAYVFSFLGFFPLLFFAQYRARRYVLLRTHWRGLRFSQDRGARFYALFALANWVFAIATLGILWPRKTFRLEKYRIDRTRFGRSHLHQSGRWDMLVPAAVHAWIGLFLSIGAVLASRESGNPGMLWMLCLSLPWLAYGIVHYQVESFRILAAHKSMGPVGLRANPDPHRVAQIYFTGYGLTFMVAISPLIALGMVLALAQASGLTGGIQISDGLDPQEIAQILNSRPSWLQAAVAVGIYFAVFLLWSTLGYVFVTMPLMRHYAESLQITGAHGLASVRPRDDIGQHEAEGFAEALDVGPSL